MNSETNTQMEQEYSAEQEETTMQHDAVPFLEEAETPASLLAEDGSFAPGWTARFDDLAAAEKTLAKFKRPEALAKSYAELEKLRSYPELEDASRMALFRSFVGLPEKPEDFHLARPEGIPEDCWNEDLAGSMARVAHEYGVPSRAMEALAETYGRQYADYLEQSETSGQESKQEAEESLRRDWGNDFDKARAEAVSAVRILSEKAGISSSDILEDPGLASNPVFIKMMREAALMMGEAPLRRGGEAELVPSEEARRIESDPDHPLHDAYMKPSHPNHRYANEVYDRLAFGRK